MRRCASSVVTATAGPSPSGPPTRRRRSAPVVSCSRPRRRRPPGCSPRSAPSAAGDLAGIESASVAVVTLAFPRSAVAGLERPARASSSRRSSGGGSRPAPSPSPSGTGCARPAATSRSCAPRSGGTARRPPAGDRRRARREVARRAGGRWPASSPTRRHARAAVGRRAAAVRRRPPRPGRPDPCAPSPVPGLAVCGAAYDGVGIPACIASAHRRGRRACATAQ